MSLRRTLAPFGDTVTFEGRDFKPRKGGWKTSKLGMARLIERNRLILLGNTLSYVRFVDDFPEHPGEDILSMHGFLICIHQYSSMVEQLFQAGAASLE